jgi:glycosyltransferase involved in cell wall biosynthesis
MKKIIHFHPNGKYSDRFINPLKMYEKKIGFHSIIVNDICPTKKNLQIDYVLKTNNFLIFPFNFILLILYIYRLKPDIIFCHNSTSAWSPMLAARFLFIKNIVYFNHGVPFVGYKGLIRFILYLIEKINCLLSKEIVTVSNAMKYKLESITKKNVHIIHNGSAAGVDLGSFQKYEASKVYISMLKQKYNINKNNKIILFVGRANQRKGFYDVIEIWKKYFECRPDYTLLLLGVDKKDVLKRYKKMPYNIKAMSFVPNPKNFFIMSDYLFMNSYHEGLNYSVIEAMLFDTIVISNNILGVSDIIQNNINGFLVDNNNHQLFFNIVNSCEESIALKNRIIKDSKVSIKKFDRIEFFKSYVCFLRKL